MLADSRIRSWLSGGGLQIDPFRSEHVQPASYDVTFDRFDRPIPQTGEGVWLFPPGAFALGCTVERVRIPRQLAAIIDGKSTMGRLGLSIHQTAGYIDPGFEGQITLELHNVSEDPVEIRRGMRIGQLRFFKVDGEVRRPYGHPDLGSHYQGQTGPTAPAVP